MKYRVRLDLSFDPVSAPYQSTGSSTGEADAQALADYARTLAGKAVSVNEGKDNEEISFCEMEICRHDEGLPCIRLDRVEVRKQEVARL